MKLLNLTILLHNRRVIQKLGSIPSPLDWLDKKRHWRTVSRPSHTQSLKDDIASHCHTYATLKALCVNSIKCSPSPTLPILKHSGTTGWHHERGLTLQSQRSCTSEHKGIKRKVPDVDSLAPRHRVDSHIR